jgi:hypothetical protein
MFDRYAIVSDQDVSDAMGKLETQKRRDLEEETELQKSAASEIFSHGHDSGTIVKNDPDGAVDLRQTVPVNLPN